jgi:hypothetical protein
MGELCATTFSGLSSWYHREIDKFGWMIMAYNCHNSPDDVNYPKEEGSKFDEKKHKVETIVHYINTLKYLKTKMGEKLKKTDFQNTAEYHDLKIMKTKLTNFIEVVMKIITTTTEKTDPTSTPQPPVFTFNKEIAEGINKNVQEGGSRKKASKKAKKVSKKPRKVSRKKTR